MRRSIAMWSVVLGATLVGTSFAQDKDNFSGEVAGTTELSGNPDLARTGGGATLAITWDSGVTRTLTMPAGGATPRFGLLGVEGIMVEVFLGGFPSTQGGGIDLGVAEVDHSFLCPITLVVDGCSYQILNVVTEWNRVQTRLLEGGKERITTVSHVPLPVLDAATESGFSNSRLDIDADTGAWLDQPTLANIHNGTILGLGPGAISLAAGDSLVETSVRKIFVLCGVGTAGATAAVATWRQTITLTVGATAAETQGFALTELLSLVHAPNIGDADIAILSAASANFQQGIKFGPANFQAETVERDAKKEEKEERKEKKREEKEENKEEKEQRKEDRKNPK